MYKKIYAKRIDHNKHLIHLWTDTGYEKIEWMNRSYIDIDKNQKYKDFKAQYTGLNDESLIKTSDWRYTADKESHNYSKNTIGLHFHDIPAHQKFLIEKYGIDDTPSVTHKELFFDIECEMLDDLSYDGIKRANKKVTSIAWYDKQVDEWGIVCLL